MISSLTASDTDGKVVLPDKSITKLEWLRWGVQTGKFAGDTLPGVITTLPIAVAESLVIEGERVNAKPY